MISNAVVLLSGGLDSATTLALAKAQGFIVHALSVYYGQRNDIELKSAKNIANLINIHEHKIINLDLRLFGKSSLTDDILPDKHGSYGANIPNTYVPARNTILLALALAFAESIEANNIFLGANIHDYSGYPDCRPDYINAFSVMANLATKAALLGNKININTPLINLTKAEIIKLGLSLGLDYSLTHSCYNPIDGLACKECSSCFYRHKGFIEAGIKDPTLYYEA